MTGDVFNTGTLTITDHHKRECRAVLEDEGASHASLFATPAGSASLTRERNFLTLWRMHSQTRTRESS